ncbi:hypothetical protein SDC9_192473 [bioreactor metagenome]|uniref:Uncharacterized protein n=1 Tax=bioreactor metagenome TaxID=1076179 RepID=A0A645I230_9ZZZZ
MAPRSSTTGTMAKRNTAVSWPNSVIKSNNKIYSRNCIYYHYIIAFTDYSTILFFVCKIVFILMTNGQSGTMETMVRRIFWGTEAQMAA